MTTTMPMPPPNDVALAVRLRGLYCTYRSRYENDGSTYGLHKIPRWDGGRDRYGRNFQPVWPRLAAAVASWQADPALFMAAQFYEAARAPLPTDMTNAAAFARYRSYVETLPTELAAALAIMHNIAAGAAFRAARLRGLPCDSVAVWRAVLLDETVELSALYRWCAAVRNGISDTADLFAASARWQRDTAPAAYAAGWADFLPD